MYMYMYVYIYIYKYIYMYKYAYILNPLPSQTIELAPLSSLCIMYKCQIIARLHHSSVLGTPELPYCRID